MMSAEKPATSPRAQRNGGDVTYVTYDHESDGGAAAEFGGQRPPAGGQIATTVWSRNGLFVPFVSLLLG